jgi:hypothetical protein
MIILVLMIMMPMSTVVRAFCSGIGTMRARTHSRQRPRLASRSARPPCIGSRTRARSVRSS